MDLKIGDIKKFKTDKVEVVGMVISTNSSYSSNAYEILDICGSIRHVPKNATISATRLDPKIREAFENISNAQKDMNKFKKELKEIQSKIYKQSDIIEKSKLELIKLNGFMSDVEFKNTVYNNLHASVRLELRSRKYEEMYLYENQNGIFLRISRDEDIQKYVQEGTYSFIGMEYDNTLFIDTNGGKDKDYKELIKRYSRTNINIEIKNTKAGYVSERNYLSIGDKNWLTFTHDIEIAIPEKGFTKDNALKMAKLLKLK